MTLKKKLWTLIPICLMWFVFGTLMIKRGSIDKEDLKLIFGRLNDWGITEIKGHKHNIDVLYFNVANSIDRPALYLNTRKDYEPIVNKIFKGGEIKILYNDKGLNASEGYNLHIYQIEFNNEILIDYDSISNRDKKVGKILYIVGLIFMIPILIVYRQDKIKTKAATNRVDGSASRSWRSAPLTPLYVRVSYTAVHQDMGRTCS